MQMEVYLLFFQFSHFSCIFTFPPYGEVESDKELKRKLNIGQFGFNSYTEEAEELHRKVKRKL